MVRCLRHHQWGQVSFVVRTYFAGSIEGHEPLCQLKERLPSVHNASLGRDRRRPGWGWRSASRSTEKKCMRRPQLLLQGAATPTFRATSEASLQNGSLDHVLPFYHKISQILIAFEMSQRCIVCVMEQKLQCYQYGLSLSWRVHRWTALFGGEMNNLKLQYFEAKVGQFW